MEHREETRRAFVEAELAASAGAAERLRRESAGAILRGVDAIIRALGAGKKVLLCGNGGSAADAQHLATELVIRMNPAIRRPGLPAIALTTDSSMLTAGANDIGYDNVFAREVEALGCPGDVLIAISTSGNSESVNRAVRTARERGLVTVGLLGRGGGTTGALVDVAVVMPSDDTQRIQEGHITAGHIMFALAERELYGEAPARTP
ncbi:MAG TPA: SIS domain-containing protein [Bacteroidota bacterium]|nr:SIS domain-containing protein [Bacteroidota bacterium]